MSVDFKMAIIQELESYSIENTTICFVFLNLENYMNIIRNAMYVLPDLLFKNNTLNYVYS